MSNAPKKSKWKETAANIWYKFLAVLLTLYAIGQVFGPHESRPRDGDPCGPGHHWGYVGYWENADLSCEPD